MNNDSKLDIHIIPDHRSFCVWDLFIDGEWIETFGSAQAAENYAEKLQAEHDAGCQEQP